MEEYEEIINNFPKDKNQSKYNIRSQIRQMARMEASNTEIHNNMSIMPNLNSTGPSKRNVPVLSHYPGPALIDGSLQTPNP
jgi:hypothetical protein